MRRLSPFKFRHNPNLQDLSNFLHGSTIFSKIDLEKGYHQIPMQKSDIPKTAIITPFGLFEFLYMPFGLSNAAQTFQTLMDSLIHDFPFIFIYFIYATPPPPLPINATAPVTLFPLPLSYLTIAKAQATCPSIPALLNNSSLTITSIPISPDLKLLGDVSTPFFALLFLCPFKNQFLIMFIH